MADRAGPLTETFEVIGGERRVHLEGDGRSWPSTMTVA